MSRATAASPSEELATLISQAVAFDAFVPQVPGPTEPVTKVILVVGKTPLALMVTDLKVPSAQRDSLMGPTRHSA